MNTNQYHVIGLMSGTSLDGLDIAFCHFKNNHHHWTFSILKTKSIEYQDSLAKRLKNAISLNAADLLVFHNYYGTWLGNQVNDFIHQNNLGVDFISSHGHTIFHQPEIGLTYQIGSGQHLANTCNHKVICDFRTNDISMGGQGAPLVPIGDQLLFSEYDFCLNLGGISNISFHQNNKRIAYDISPANMLLNHICSKINKPYDDKGKIAKTGKLNPDLLDRLNRIEYYTLPIPKSLGYEWFSKEVIPIIEASQHTIEDILHTAVHHIAIQIAQAIKSNCTSKGSSLLITGGGAKNDFLIEVLKEQLEGYIKICIPPKEIIDYKEALIFAFMGVLKDRNEVNCLKSVTGAIKDTSSGVVYFPS